MNTYALYTFLTPTTLAAIIHDLHGEPAARIERDLARRALNCNIGEDAAREMIEAAEVRS